MTNPIRKQKTGFTQVANEVLHDPQLSWKAKGLYAYIYSKPDGWDFSCARMAWESKDGRKSTLAAAAELEARGFITRRKLGTGRVIYEVRVEPKSLNGIQAIEPKSQSPTVGLRHRAETAPISNKESESIKKRNNKNLEGLRKKTREALAEKGILR